MKDKDYFRRQRKTLLVGKRNRKGALQVWEDVGEKGVVLVRPLSAVICHHEQNQLEEK